MKNSLTLFVMNKIIYISNPIKVVFLAIIFIALYACSKGGEPTPMASTTNQNQSSALIQNNTQDNSTFRVVGGDDKEDDDDNRGTTYPKRK